MYTGYNITNASKKDYCTSSPCRNAGQCVSLRTTYYYRCKTPYYGINCDKSQFYLHKFIKKQNFLHI